MQRVTLVLLAIAMVPAAAQTLQITPTEIHPGDRATLSWDVSGARAFVLGYGEVTGKGSATVEPTITTDYILTAEYEGPHPRFEYRTQRLVVAGGRGEDEMLLPADFGTPVSGSNKGASYIDFQKNTWELLQQEGYKVRGDFAPQRPYVTLYTDFVLRPDLIAHGEKIRAKRLALSVDIYQPQKGEPITFGVHTKLEFQYVGERQWRPDKDSPLASAEAMKAVHLLGGMQ